jgi:hypothetical protein
MSRGTPVVATPIPSANPLANVNLNQALNSFVEIAKLAAEQRREAAKAQEPPPVVQQAPPVDFAPSFHQPIAGAGHIAQRTLDTGSAAPVVVAPIKLEINEPAFDAAIEAVFKQIEEHAVKNPGQTTKDFMGLFRMNWGIGGERARTLNMLRQVGPDGKTGLEKLVIVG